MNKSILTQAGIEYDKGVERCVGNAGLYESLLARYSEDPRLADAAKWLEQRDYDSLFAYIHEIKGVTGNLSIMRVYNLASELTEILRAKKYDLADGAFTRFSQEYTAAMAAIRAASEG